ncbi:MAG: hypothetical protein LBI03_11380, partial [Clostridiales bacterium]|nr:hypothetical protein [Clostridiales bacterium]
NALAGFILAFCNEEPETGALSFSLNNETVRLVIGGLSFITGILKILSPMPENYPVIGDLFPALTGLVGGFILVFDFYQNKATESAALDYMERIASLIGRNRKLIGLVCIAAATLHFIFYQIIFL